MTDENTSQNDSNHWSVFHRTSEKLPVNCNKVKGQYKPSDKCLFHKDIFQSVSLVTCPSTELDSKVRLVKFRGSSDAEGY
jgi:hypothetical protein